MKIDLTDFAKSLCGKPVAIFGLGLSGLTSVEALINAGIKTIAWDDGQESVNKAKALGAKCQPLDTKTLSGCAVLLLSPGVPLTHPQPHPVAKAAQEAGIEIIGDLEILHRANHGHKTIGITGTNGKSTTTALLTHVLKACGRPAVMGGNIGVPVLKLDLPTPDTIIVLEISSYQIDLCPTFRPDIGVLLNITPDHINRHGTFENYTAIKNLMLEGAQQAIRPQDLDIGFLKDENFPRLPGDHNKQNIAAVCAVCKIIGLEQDKVIEAVKTFPGLPHRQFLTRQINNVSYINDSKATNAQAAAKALGAYENIFWIVGGQAKEGGLSGLEDYKSRIAHAYLIGESTPAFETWMKERGIDYTLSNTLETAVPQAHEAAQKQNKPASVLLAPACASWDQFKSFEHRGDAFTQIVEGLNA